MGINKQGTPPTSQHDRPIALVMFLNGINGGVIGLSEAGPVSGFVNGFVGGFINGFMGSIAPPFGSILGLGGFSSPYEYYFQPRPEEMTYSHPARATVVQTLGGAWVDDFGEGIVDITMSGTTGWRANDYELGPLSMARDGMQKALELRTTFFETFHKERMAAAQSGMDPDEAVKMYLVDTLNSALWHVYPMSMQIRRNKSRPLLYQYQIKLLGLNQVNQGYDTINVPGLGLPIAGLITDVITGILS